MYMPVKTVWGDDEPSAVVGTASIVKGSRLSYWSDGIPDEDRLFKVYVLLPGGDIVGSDPVPVSF